MENKEQSKNEKIIYPRYIDNAPCKADLFKGGSHSKIAKNIAQLLSQNQHCNVVGIDGGWGSGKSNLVELVKDCLEKDESTKGRYKFFIYDAWGHQDDLQRRSILEELTSFLTHRNEKEKGILDTEKWSQKLKDLLAKKREVETKTIPQISCGIILTALAVVFTPLLDVITDAIESKLLKIIIMSIPIGVALILFLRLLWKHRKKEGCIKHSISDFFNIYTDKQKEDTTFETISEDEPSSRKFRNWMHEIDTDVEPNTVVIVFDNMDRLPSQKVQELWSAIHSFFADEKYNNIRVLVPFDREHIKSAFKNEDIEGNDEGVESTRKCFGDDFINKTFNVVYRVSPPTMSNWKNYFNDQWMYAFGKKADDYVTQIYDLLTQEQTPRKIIAFINEFVSIKQLVANDIPDKYIALFIFGKNKIAQNPNIEILRPTYLGALDFLYKDDIDLPKYISALYYQLPAEKALDIIYTEKLKQALDNNNIEQIKSIQCSLNVFFSILENSITKVSNIPNTIIALNTCLSTENTKQELVVWNCVYSKVNNGSKENTLQEYQKILVQKISAKEEYLKAIVNDFSTAQGFNATAFYESIKQLSLLDNIDPFPYLKEKEVEPEMFIAFVEQAKDEYSKYTISCNQDKLNEYLNGLDIEHLNMLHAIPYLENEYKMSSYNNYLNSLIDSNLTNKDNIKILYTRIKEVKRPIEKIIPDGNIYTFFNGTTNTEDFYYDLICMRLARLNNFNPSYQSQFSAVLNNTEDKFVEKVAERIEYYMDYGTILLNAQIMNFPLYKAVAKKLTVTSYGKSRMNILNVLQKYDVIIDNLELEPVHFIDRCNEYGNLEETNINSSNIFSLPIRFFKDVVEIENKLSKYCKSMAEEYLKSISTEDWKQSIIDGNYDYELLMTLKPKVQKCFDAFKQVLLEHIKGQYPTLSKDRCNKIIQITSRSLSTAFKAVRDCFCGGQTSMTDKMFDFYGEWLLKYSELEGNNSSLRTIFISTILDKEENIELLCQYKDKMIQIVKNAGEENKDFKDKIQSLLDGKYKENTSFISFAKAIGIEKTEPIEEDKQE